jgi:hypothetical protein
VFIDVAVRERGIEDWGGYGRMRESGPRQTLASIGWPHPQLPSCGLASAGKAENQNRMYLVLLSSSSLQTRMGAGSGTIEDRL